MAEKLLFSGPDYVSVPSFRPIAAASKNPHLLGQKDRQTGQTEGQTDRRKDKFTEFIAPPRFFLPENLELSIGSAVQKLCLCTCVRDFASICTDTDRHKIIPTCRKVDKQRDRYTDRQLHMHIHRHTTD